MNTTQEPTYPSFVKQGINLASRGLGARELFATDEFFAPLERMIEDSPAIFIPDKYDDHGKWMDGWESRRRRDGGHDYAIIRLATRGIVLGVDFDTSHFTGNYPPAARLEGCLSETDDLDNAEWFELVGMSQLGPDAHHYVDAITDKPVSHIRLHIHPDGGMARLRVYGVPLLSQADSEGEIDLASSLHGGRIIAFSDAHYGAYQRLLFPGRGQDMGDGWETRRRREPGNDWIIIALGARGVISRAHIDTAYYKGNFPDSCSIQAADLSQFSGNLEEAIIASSIFWDTILPAQKLSADAIHEFTEQIAPHDAVTHVRLNIYPDGGVSRLRLFGEVSQ